MDPVFAVQSAESASPPPAVSANGTSAAGTGTPALPSLNPTDSPYQPLALPEVQTPTQHPLDEQQPQQNLGAATPAGAFAYLADQTLRGAIKGYDQARLQKAQQFNKKLSALSALEKDLGQQYKDAYNEVGSSSPDMTPEKILADPKVKQLHNQLLAVHQASLGAISSYLPPLTTDKKTGKTKEKKNLLQRMFDHQDNPDEALRAYAEAAGQLGPQAFYQVARPDQLKSMYQERQGKGAAQTADTATAQTATQTEALKQEKMRLLSGPQTDESRARVAQIDEALTPPTTHPTLAQTTRYEKKPDGSTEQYQIDAGGQEVPGTRKPLAGKAGEPTPPPKSPTMKAGVWNGQNVNAYYDLPHHVWINSDGGQPIPGFHPAPTFGQLGLYEPVLTATPDGHLVSGTFNRRTGETRAQTVATGGPLAPPVAREVSKSLEPAVEADTRYKIMHDNAMDALKGNQQAMVSLLMNHIGMTLGAQKGTRVAKSVIDEAQDSAPWTETIFAKWGHWDPSGDWVYDGYKTGTNLTGGQIHQMLGLAKQRRERQWQQAQEGAQVYGVTITPPPLDTGVPSATKPGAKPAAKSPPKPVHQMTDDEFLLAVPKVQ